MSIIIIGKVLSFPSLLKILKSLKKKQSNISVNVLGWKKSSGDGYSFHIIRNSKYYYREKKVRLLLYNGHYTAIKSLSRLLSSSNSKDGHMQHFCDNCFGGFKSEKTRDDHFNYCVNNKAVKIVMPKIDSTIKFTKGWLQLKVPFAIYADFESILKACNSREGDPDYSYTRKINKHMPLDFLLIANLLMVMLIIH